ncbi:MAG TPA: hypothetical protein VIN03_07145 [Roseateles sp.]
MQFPQSTHADGWHAQMPARSLPDIPIVTRDADAVSPPLHSRRFHAMAMLVAVLALGASAGLDAVDDPRPLDVQLSAAMHNAANKLREWQGQLSRGLQVSLRAVADGRDTAASASGEAPTVVAQAEPDARVDADDRDQPIRADVAPRQMQPVR